jgi:hypothetical protein
MPRMIDLIRNSQVPVEPDAIGGARSAVGAARGDD